MEEITLGQNYPQDVRRSHIEHPIDANAICEDCGGKMKPIINDAVCIGYECSDCGFKSNWVAGASTIVDDGIGR